jgi:PadR family transcriptional regulator, regulatory protein PadR
MTGQALCVHTALADGPRHGYGIVSEVARLRLKTGHLHGLLDRLAAAGLTEPDREEAHDGRPRRYYRPTRDGQRASRAGSGQSPLRRSHPHTGSSRSCRRAGNKLSSSSAYWPQPAQPQEA